MRQNKSNKKNRMFSICVPVYNVEKYLPECIESVLNQTYENFELILVDDGSKDGSLKICRKYEIIDDRVKVFSKANEGQLATRKFAFEKSCGDIILCLDSDDYIDKDSLRVLNDFFEKYNCDCVYFNWRRVNDRKEIKQEFQIRRIELLTEKSVLFKKIFMNATFNSMCLKAFRREFIPQRRMEDFFQIRHGEDLIQTIEILQDMGAVLFVPDVLYNYRVNYSSVSHVQSNKTFEVGNAVRFFVYNFLKRNDLFSELDWDEYGCFCAKLLLSDLILISRFDCSLEEKEKLLEKERNSAYYELFVKYKRTRNAIKDVPLYLFEKKDYLLVIFTCKALSFLVSCVRRVRIFFNFARKEPVKKSA